MHMFFRSQRVTATRMDDAIAHLVHVQAMVKHETGVDTTVSRALAGLPAETLLVTARLDSFAEYESYLSAIKPYALNLNPGTTQNSDAQGPLFDTAPCDLFAEVVATANVDEPRQYELIVVAQIGEEAFDRALEWGSEATQYIGDEFKCPIIFCHAPYGPGGHLRWCLGFDSADEVEAAGREIFADPGYLDRLRQSGPIFGRRSSTRFVVKKIDKWGMT